MVEQMVEKNNASLEVAKSEENKLKAVLDALIVQAIPMYHTQNHLFEIYLHS